MITPTPTRTAASSVRAHLPALAGALLLAVAGAIHTAHAQEEPNAAAEIEPAGEGSAEGTGEDFPTTAIADYVLGCMAANGNTHEALQQCSCSIDFIKARMDYKTYEEVETILKVQRDVGQRGMFYRDSNWAKRRVERLEALQAESTLRCF